MVQALETRTNVVTGVIDGDGHIFERDEQIAPYLASKYKPYQLQNYYFFPDLDGHRRLGRGPEWGTDDAEGWIRFLDHAGIASTVIYPTAALGFGWARGAEWARDVTAAYNNFVYDSYLRVNPRLQAVALLPIQDPPAAAAELKRAVTELGMVGGLLPTPVLRRMYGEEVFDPLYREAERLGVVLSVHGAAQRGLGFDGIEDPSVGFILAHPFGQMTQFVSMLYGGVWDRFPRLKVAFLEASCGWVPAIMERIDQRTARRGRPLATDTIRNCPIYFHAELADGESLRTAISYVGADRLIYASDFPHEGVEDIVEGLQEFLAREDLDLAVKEKILRDNIKAMYNLS